MLKKISTLKGAKQLSKTEQKNISGGSRSLCAGHLIYCSDSRIYDPCAPITENNFSC